MKEIVKSRLLNHAKQYATVCCINQHSFLLFQYLWSLKTFCICVAILTSQRFTKHHSLVWGGISKCQARNCMQGFCRIGALMVFFFPIWIRINSDNIIATSILTIMFDPILCCILLFGRKCFSAVVKTIARKLVFLYKRNLQYSSWILKWKSL